MTTTDEQPSPFEEAVEKYLTLLDAGTPPDTDEFCAAHPECADELRGFISNLDFVDDQFAEAGIIDQTADDTTVTDDNASTLPNHKGFSIEDTTAPGTGSERSSGSRVVKVRGYTLLGEIGGGSQGIIYKAEEPRTKRTVALKVIREGAFATDLERLRFQNEVEVASSLTHPAIVRVYRSGEDHGRNFFTMEYIDGDPLDDYTSGRTLSIEQTLELFLEICDGATYAHRRGVIHRDLKPSNILVDAEGKPHILDFGLAKRLAGEDRAATPTVTRAGEFAGTWHYASPEQIKRDRGAIDIRTDVYALGVILYEMLTDGYPYPCDSDFRDDIARHVLETPATPPRQIRSELRGDLETIILRAIHKDVRRRYQSAAELAEDVRRFLGGFPIESERDSLWYVARLAYRRHRLRVIAGAAALAALIAFSITTWVLFKRAEKAEATILARMDLMRSDESYLVDRLGKGDLRLNILRRIEAAHPGLPELQRQRKPEHHDPESFFEPVRADMLAFVFHAMVHEGCSGRPEATEWLERHQADLLHIEETTRSHRFVFGQTHHLRREPGWDRHAQAPQPRDYGGARNAAEALLARALLHQSTGHPEAALASLMAVRSIALDLEDGQHEFYDEASRMIRMYMYHAFQIILDGAGERGTNAEPHATWILTDPPFAGEGLTAVSRRLAKSRRIEDVTFADSREGPPYVDLDLLNEHTGGRLERYGAVTDQTRRWARSTTPQEMIDAFDTLHAKYEAACDWTWPQLRDHGTSDLKAAPPDGQKNPLKAMLDDPWPEFHWRGRMRTNQAAVFLTVYLCQYRSRHGEWPISLTDALPADAKHLLHDSYSDEPFVYKLLDDGPILYSLNEDCTDNGGRAGDWCDNATDIVHFLPGRPWQPASAIPPITRSMYRKMCTPHDDPQ